MIVQKTQQANIAKIFCGFCSGPGHAEDRCLLNPANPKNRLDALRTDGKKNGEEYNKGLSVGKKEEKKKKMEKDIVATARVSTNNEGKNRVMSGSGTIMHTTPILKKVTDEKSCECR